MPMLYAKTRECRFLDRINCKDCPAPLKFDCGGEIKYIKPTTQFYSINADLVPVGIETKTIKQLHVSKFADSFNDDVPRFTLKSPPGTANEFVNNIGKNIIYGNQANPQKESFVNKGVGYIVRKIKVRTQPPEIIKKYGEERIAREAMGIIRPKDFVVVSYNIDDQDLYQNPNGNHEGKVQDNFCWYSSVPQVVGFNSPEDRQKCSIKFCFADVKCKIKQGMFNYKAFCNAIGTNYDKCPKAVDCINRKNISTNNPSNWEPYLKGQEIEKTPVTKEEKIAWNKKQKIEEQLDNWYLGELPFWRKYNNTSIKYDNAKAKYKKGIISENAVKQAWNEVEQSFQQMRIAIKERDQKEKQLRKKYAEARNNYYDIVHKRREIDRNKEPRYFPPGSWIPITGEAFDYYTSLPQVVSFPPATNSRPCNMQFCIADARNRGWSSDLKAICKTTDGTCPIQAQECIETTNVSVKNLSNPLEVEGVSLLAEIPQAHQKTQPIYQEGENNEYKANDSGPSGSVQ